MSLTITIPGAVEATIGATAPAVLTVGVGTPGATGPAGPAGVGVPAGGLTAQFLQKTSNASYATDWVTLPAYLPLAGGTMNVNAVVDFEDTTAGTVSEIGGYGFAVSSASNVNLLSNVLYNRVFVKNATSQTSIKPTGVEFPDLTLQTTAGLSPATASSTYQTLAGMSSYLTTSAAASTYAVTARGLPASGTVGQVLVKNSGTDYDASFQTLIPGDRYLTTSSTSNAVSNGAKTFTVGTGLSYTTQQDVTIAYDASHHMHALVTSYNSGTGVLVVDVQQHTGTGTYTAWTVNVGGTVPLASVAWGDIMGTLGDQSDLATALNAKSPIASPTFTGTVTIPAGASISGYLSLSANSTISGSNVFSGATNTFSGTTLTFGNSTAASTINVGSGAIPNGVTKSVNIGINGAPGSTHTIIIGSAAGTSTTTLRGTVTVPTATASSSDTIVANTAYVANEISTKANIASPSLTGTPRSTTAAADTNTTQIATTAFVIGQASSTTPSATGTAAVGTSLKYARADHVHLNPLPAGGTTGQVLSKVDGTSYNVAWTTPSGGSAAWGAITGTLSSQTDLQNALDAKLALSGGTMTGALAITGAITMTGTQLYNESGVSGIDSGGLSWSLTNTGVAWNNGTQYGSFNSSGIRFGDGTTQSTAGYPASGNPSGFLTDAPADGSTYGRNNNAWGVISSGLPGQTNAVWAYSMWYSANVTNIYDSGTSTYYNVLTF
jgi:hypothetical protein